MNHPFQPLGFGLHGVQVTRSTHEVDMAAETPREKILAVLDEAGGMATAAQIREETPDLSKPQRWNTLSALSREGVITAEGSPANRLYSLVRPGNATADIPATGAAPAPARASSDEVRAPAVTAPAPPQPRDTFALRARLDCIADDLQDALEDACRGKLTHDLLAHLVAAAGAVRGACKALPPA
ncbi:hypothetical protein [uncultured Xanthomonas sp.]|uniref:helix-turn-helix transcriptional regulator n=1 Tax=uncultured Xanthomonas sp. TaxID=152831 RepID=UPI0025E1CC15|nr:hypothetical protein [uncultured Xanthomonas sp.]